MNGLNLCMPINSLGFGIHAMTVIKALARGNSEDDFYSQTHLQLIGDGHNIKQLCEEYDIPEEQLRGIIREPNTKYPTLILWHPHESGVCKIGTRRIMITHFETDQLTPREVKSLESVDHVLVCSMWALEVVRAHNIASVSLIPGACATTALADLLAEDGTVFWPIDWLNRLESKLLNQDAFRLISVGKWETRKGQERLVEALSPAHELKDIEVIAFWSNPFNGGLVPTKSFLVDQGWTLEIQGWIAEYSAYVDKWTNKTNSIILMPPVTNQRDLIKVISTGDAYISVSSGEGWDQPLVEAMAAGVPCIATHNTAHRMYCTIESSWLIPCNTETAHDGKWFTGDRGRWYPCVTGDIVTALNTFRATPPARVKEVVSHGKKFIVGYTDLLLVHRILMDQLFNTQNLETDQ